MSKTRYRIEQRINGNWTEMHDLQPTTSGDDAQGYLKAYRAEFPDRDIRLIGYVVVGDEA